MGLAVSAHDRIRRQQLVRQAEGYLELEMPVHALAAIERMGPDEQLGEKALLLRGTALKELGRFAEAIGPLKRVAAQSPENIQVWLSLGWCYKRVERLDLAIEALEEALAAEPGQAIVNYNLACYWSLAGNKRQAILFLAQAIELDNDYRYLAGDEHDFDAIRDDPAFQALARVIV